MIFPYIKAIHSIYSMLLEQKLTLREIFFFNACIKISPWKELNELHHQQLKNNMQLIGPHKDQAYDLGHSSTYTKNKDSLRCLNSGHASGELYLLSSPTKAAQVCFFHRFDRKWFGLFILNALKIGSVITTAAADEHRNLQHVTC